MKGKPITCGSELYHGQMVIFTTPFGAEITEARILFKGDSVIIANNESGSTIKDAFGFKRGVAIGWLSTDEDATEGANRLSMYKRLGFTNLYEHKNSKELIYGDK